jgi:hypothetical protein
MGKAGGQIIQRQKSRFATPSSKIVRRVTLPS